MSVEQIKEALDEADQVPMVILKHNEWPYELAELKESDDFDDRNKYLEVVDHINWHSVSMRREDFESQIDQSLVNHGEHR